MPSVGVSALAAACQWASGSGLGLAWQWLVQVPGIDLEQLPMPTVMLAAGPGPCQAAWRQGCVKILLIIAFT